MADPQRISEKTREYEDASGAVRVPLTGARRRSLLSICSDMKNMAQFNMKYSGLGPGDVEGADLVTYLFEKFFPDGDVPEQLKGYAEFARMVGETGSSSYGAGVERKRLAQRDVLEDIRSDDPEVREKAESRAIDMFFYEQALVGVVEADEVRPEESRVLVRYDGDTLLEENLPAEVFSGLPKGSTVVYDLTSQTLELNLDETLKKAKDAERMKVQEAIVTGMRGEEGTATRTYLEDLAEELEEQL
jgi:hypothetical protein